MIQFQGFDAVTINNTFIRLERDQDIRLQDQMKLCALLIHRGSNISKIALKMSSEGRAEVGKLQTKYKIQPGGQGSQAKEIVTLARIGATYPLFCGLAANTELFSPKYGDWQDTIVPKAFSLPQIAACFPKGDIGQKLMALQRPLIKAFDKLINKKPNFQNALAYQKVQFTSPLGNDEQRIQWALKLGLITIVKSAEGASASGGAATYVPTFTRENIDYVLRNEKAASGDAG